jgi:hypothetical protein
MNRKAQIAVAEVDNPNYSRDHPENLGNPRTIMVSINRRADAVTSLWIRGFLEDHQKRAADRFTAAWRIMQGLHGGSFGEHVDHRQEPSISEDVIDAGRQLQECRGLLGVRSYDLVCVVCGEGKALSDLFPMKRQRLTAADNLRVALDDMARMWGYMQRRGS